MSEVENKVDNIMDMLNEEQKSLIVSMIRHTLLREEGIDPDAIGFSMEAYYTMDCPHCNKENDDE